MPWTESHSLISSDHRDPSTCDSNSIRTVVVSEADGIQAIVGKPVGVDKTVTLSYLFAKYKGWTMQKAQDWFKEHEHTAEVPPGYFPVVGAAPGSGLKETMRYIGANGRRMLLIDDGTFVTVGPEEAFQKNAMVAAARNATQPTVGDLTGQKWGTYEEPQPPPEISNLVGQPLHMWGFTKGKTEAAPTPVMPRSSGRFDPTQPTVGSLVGEPLQSIAASGIRGGASDVAFGVHPHGIKEVSR
jgi:hypothetical protein